VPETHLNAQNSCRTGSPASSILVNPLGVTPNDAEPQVSCLVHWSSKACFLSGINIVESTNPSRQSQRKAARCFFLIAS
jgi:hypothetical protein